MFFYWTNGLFPVLKYHNALINILFISNLLFLYSHEVKFQLGATGPVEESSWGQPILGTKIPYCFLKGGTNSHSH